MEKWLWNAKWKFLWNLVQNAYGVEVGVHSTVSDLLFYFHAHKIFLKLMGLNLNGLKGLQVLQVSTLRLLVLSFTSVVG